jgi:hypothetical protein
MLMRNQKKRSRPACFRRKNPVRPYNLSGVGGIIVSPPPGPELSEYASQLVSSPGNFAVVPLLKDITENYNHVPVHRNPLQQKVR